jgi:hypothetical protein
MASTRTLALATSALLLAGSAAPALADGHGKGQGHGAQGHGAQGHGAGQGQGAQAHGAQDKGAKTDPPGNNGTFKVDGVPYDDGKGNEPHVSCGFRLKFYGFDAGQTGDITIAGQAPSGSGLVSSRTGVLISDDAAGGGNDLDAVVPYTAADLDLTGLTAHPKQGYHLKVTLSTDTPGGVKHKVFWYEPCATAPETTPGTTGPEVGGTGGTVTPPEQTPAQPRTAVLGTRLTRTGAAAATERTSAAAPSVLGTRATRAAGLPFTGSYAALLALAGGLLIASGTGVLVAARR